MKKEIRFTPSSKKKTIRIAQKYILNANRKINDNFITGQPLYIKRVKNIRIQQKEQKNIHIRLKT